VPIAIARATLGNPGTSWLERIEGQRLLYGSGTNTDDKNDLLSPERLKERLRQKTIDERAMEFKRQLHEHLSAVAEIMNEASKDGIAIGFNVDRNEHGAKMADLIYGHIEHQGRRHGPPNWRRIG
jgi:hypothetical protein